MGVSAMRLLCLTLLAALSGPWSQAQSTPPRLLYLAPDESGVQRIWLADPEAPQQTQPITQNAVSIYYYDVHPQGQALAYAGRERPGGPSDLFELSLADGQLTRLLACVQDQTDCREPLYSPDGRHIAFEQMFIPPDALPGPPQIMLLDHASLNVQQIAEGRDAFWLGDGRLAFYDVAMLSQQIRVYDPATANTEAYDLPDGGTVTFSPDGQRRVYSILPHAMSPAYRQMLIGDQGGTGRPLLPEDPAYSDEAALWHPQGQRILIQRLPLLEETAGYQFFWVWPGQNRSEALLPDADWAHLQPRFSPDGTWLAFVRGAVAQDLQVWVYELSSGRAWPVANGQEARWITSVDVQQSSSK